MRNSTSFSTTLFGKFLSRTKIQPRHADQPSTKASCCTTGMIFRNLMICAWMFPCTYFMYGQSSDCVPNNVANENNSLWSEQCYLGDDCEEQGNPCQANDVRMLGCFVGDANGGPVTTCSLGNPVPFYLWGTFYNNTNTMRYAVRTTSELFINNNLNTIINQCSFDEIPPGNSEVVLLGQLTYTCGDLMQLYNTWVGWSTSSAQCLDPSENNYNSECGQYPPSKCSKKIEPHQFLVPNFSFLCNGAGQAATTVCFANMTTGGTAPLTYICDYGDGQSSNNPNECHTYNATSGVYTVTFTVTDAQGVVAAATATVDLGLIECCQLTYTCPPENGGLFECPEDLPAINVDDVTVTDFCGDLDVNTSVTSTGDGCPGDTMYITYIYEISDDFSSVTCTRLFKVIDTIAPAITCQADATVSCTSAIPPVSLSSIQLDDNCDEAVTLTQLPNITTNVECPNRYILQRTFLATDACGNSTSCTQQITVNDQTPPIIVCAPDQTLSCANEIPVPNVAGIIATDVCGGGVTVVALPDVTVDQTCVNRFTLVRTYRATDVCGNSATCSQVFTISDLTSPVITCPDDLTVTCAGSVPVADITSIVVEDNCDGVPLVTVAPDLITNQSCTNQFTITRVYTATDECGNSATCAQTIVVNDSIAPTITCLADLTVSCADDVPGANINAIVVSDNCAGTVAVSVAADVITNFECANQYVITRVYTATDICGNTATCAQTITIQDNAPPSIVCPANLTLACSENVPAADISLIVTTDNCDGTATVTVATDVISDSTCINSYTISRVYTATDVCGNSTSCTQTILVDDNIPPSITCLADMTVNCVGEIPEPTTADVVVTDNCEGNIAITILPDVLSNVSCPHSFTVTRVFIATDLCGNSASCIQTIVVDDNIGPSILCPADLTVDCASAIPAPNIASVTASDNCNSASVVVTVAPDVTTNFECANSFIITRIYTATDACGNTTTCAQSITIDDDTPPSIICPAPVTVTCASDIPPVNIGGVVTSDNCEGSIEVTVAADVTANFICANRETIVRTYVATDLCGNTATCTQMITVFDETPPSIACPGDLTVSCASALPPANVNAIVTSDNCGGGVTVTVAPDVTTDFNCANEFTITRTYTAADVCGNTSTCIQTITVFDNTPPSITCPADVTVACANEIPAASIGAVITSDNCDGTVALTILADVTVSQSCVNNFTLQRTYLATDVCGNTATCSQTITINDNVAPVITCLADVTVSCASLVPVPDVSAIIATDNCGGTVTVSVAADIIEDPVCANGFIITRVYTAVDLCGNSSTCAQIITVDDNTGTTISCPPDLTVSCADDIPVPNIGVVATSDNCGGAITVTVAPDVTINTTCEDRFTIQRTYTADDACGNSSTCIQTITVFDNTPPSITCPTNVTVSCASQVPLPSISDVTSTDLCGGGVTVSVGADVTVGFTCANSFTVVRTYIATDACGNSATCTQTIVVDDNTAPTITCFADVTVTCAGDIPVANTAGIITTDNCGGVVTVIAAADITTNFICNNNFTILRTYIATDACGNTGACTQTITVDDNTLPTITCPVDLTVSCASAVPSADPSIVVAGDNCGLSSLTVTVQPDVISNQSCPNEYTITRVYVANDGCGNTASCTQIITVNDTIAPVITCPADLTVSCAGDVPTPDTASVTSSDNCEGTVAITVSADVTVDQVCPNSYTLLRTYIATDACGNTASCVQTIVVDDNTAPAITCPPDLTVLCGEEPDPDISMVSATDNCSGAVTIGFAGDTIIGEPCSYTIIYTFVATDACGNSATCEQTITVLDTTQLPVTLDLILPADITTLCYGQDPNWQVPELDPHDITVNGGCSPPSITNTETIFAAEDCAVSGYIARYEFIYTASDTCGQFDTDTFYIILIDTIPPVIHGVPDDITVTAGNIPPPPTVWATDECLCACVMLLEESALEAGCVDGKTITRTWSAMDNCGNRATAVQHITITDTDGPAMTLALDNGMQIRDGDTLSFTCASGGIPQFILDINHHTMTTSDPSGPVTMLFDLDNDRPDNCEFFGYVEQLNFNWAAIDGCGNSANMGFTVQMTDDVPPVLTGVPEIACIQDADLENIEATDLCTDASVRFWDVPIPNPCGDGTAFRRTYEAFDQCGNLARDTAILIPNDSISPQMSFSHPDLIGFENGDTMTIQCHFNTGQYSPYGPQDVRVVDGCGQGMDVRYSERVLSSLNCVNGQRVAIIEMIWIATDQCDNSARMSLVASVIDNTPPSFVDFEKEINVGCHEEIPLVIAADDCGTVTTTNQDIQLPGPCPYIYDIQRLITVTDQCGNVATIDQLIHVGDDDGPEISGIEPEVCDDLSMPVVSAWDECARVNVTVQMVQDTLEDTCADGLVVTRTWWAVDACGDTTTIIQHIILGDTIAPEIMVPNNSIILDYMNQDTIPLILMSQTDIMHALNTLNAGSISAFDNCDLELDPEFTSIITPSQNVAIDGFTEIRFYSWEVTDACGNTNLISFTVHVLDDIPPTSELPGDITVICAPLPPPATMLPDSGEVVNVQYTETITDGDDPGEFIVIRAWIMTDMSGNETIITQRITWIPDSQVECDIILPDVVECNSHGVLIRSNVTGGFPPYAYYWVIEGDSCFIQGPANTPEITIYVGWSDVKIILYVTDSAGCVTVCEAILTCDGSVEGLQQEADELSPQFTLDGNESRVKLWPNPTEGKMEMRFDAGDKDEIHITLIDFVGQKVYEEKFSTLAGINLHELDLNHLPDGAYFMNIASPTINESRKVMIVRRR